MKIVKNLFIDLEILKKQLEKAVAEEDYEKAAKIRDRINNISLGSTQ
jgi:protein-arginine kinase activator protein McsA